jgi:hypothetical protein
MPLNYLHDHKEFVSLINILAEDMNIEPGLIEKDYWIMHVLYGLKKQGFQFELKGGTSLSKGHKLIHRFSEDIDIHIKPPEEFNINENPKNTSENNANRRKEFYDWLAKEIKIPGIISIERDVTFDDTDYYRSGGIRLYYKNVVNKVSAIKDGILLEAGFDDITPNSALIISSWALDKAQAMKVEIIDNKAPEIICYNPGYTLVEKLQTIATKFRNEQTKETKGINFMRQYYDVYCLLESPEVIEFIGTTEYQAHKERRFPKADLEIPINRNEAFLLSSKEVRTDFTERYKSTEALYYKGQPGFDELLKRIGTYIDRL